MKYAMVIVMFFAFQATAQAPLVSVEIELSPATKQEISHLAAPVLRQLFQEQGCKEADFYLGINPKTLDLQIFLQCVEPKPEVENAPEKAQL